MGVARSGLVARTPGPWTIRYECNVFGPDTNYPGNERLVAGTGGHQNNRHSEAVTAENIGNARLIAAAPDLLAVVRDFRQKLATYTSIYEGDKELRRQLRDCDAALAKAEPK